MKTSRAFIIVILLLASVATFADSYQIQVTWHTRLRASHSLDSPVVATALPREVLQVVGRFNRWLKIDRNGETAWLADWVDYTRLDGQQAPPPSESTANQQQPSGIDNCCYVDRQCQSQRDWVDGYWAYQRAECPAPPQPQPGGISAPVRGHAIRIEGSHLFIGLVTEALDALRDRASRWYDYVISNLDRVTDGGEGLLWHQRTYAAAQYDQQIYFTREESVFRFVSELVHYACHSAYRHAGHPYNGYTKVNEEADCVRMDHAATDLVAAHHPPGTFGSVVGMTHCDGDLTNHPRCWWFRKNCEWGPNMTLLACPAAGLITDA